MDVMEMTEKEQAIVLIDRYTELQRIKAAIDKDSEVEYQIKTVIAKLNALGISVENLDM